MIRGKNHGVIAVVSLVGWQGWLYTKCTGDLWYKGDGAGGRARVGWWREEVAEREGLTGEEVDEGRGSLKGGRCWFKLRWAALWMNGFTHEIQRVAERGWQRMVQ